MDIRPYQPNDYENIVALYQNSELYGGQFDANRDSVSRLQKRVEADPDAILVATIGDEIVGTVSIIEEGRVAWLFRFAVAQGEHEAEAVTKLYEGVAAALKRKGHDQVLVYTPSGDHRLYERYEHLGFTKGGDYTCYWKDI